MTGEQNLAETTPLGRPQKAGPLLTIRSLTVLRIGEKGLLILKRLLHNSWREKVAYCCLEEPKIGDQKLQDYKSISATNDLPV